MTNSDPPASNQHNPHAARSPVVRAVEQIGLVGGPASLIALLAPAAGVDGQVVAAICAIVVSITAVALANDWLDRRIRSSIAVGVAAVAVVAALFFGLPAARRGGPTADACTSDAASGKPYIIRALVYTARIEKTADPATVLESLRVMYHLEAMRAIQPTEPAFVEGFHSHHPGAIRIPWPGTHTERFDPVEEGDYRVELAMAPRETRTVITGADFKLPFPFGKRPTPDGMAALSEWEDTINYPNAAEDVICDIALVVESSTLPLLREGSLMGRRGVDEAQMSNPAYRSAGGITTISGRWTNLKPKEIVWLRYRIDSAAIPPP